MAEGVNLYLMQGHRTPQLCHFRLNFVIKQGVIQTQQGCCCQRHGVMCSLDLSKPSMELNLADPELVITNRSVLDI